MIQLSTSVSVLKSVRLWAALLLLWAGMDRGVAATFVVTSAGNAGEGSLRQAIISANTNPGPDRIEFAITSVPFVIRPLTTLPPLTEAVVVDATQPGYNGVPLVEIDGANVSGDGLQILGGNSVVRGLAITHCKRNGIRITGPRGTNLIAGNYLGLTAGGTAGGNADGGITVYRSAGNTIGGTSSSERNVISGGNVVGVYMIDATARDNRILGNYIGGSADGSQIAGNTIYGIYLLGAAANTIGGIEPGAGNVISGNGQYGVVIGNRSTTGGAPFSSATNNWIAGNFIGTDATGSRGLGNAKFGVLIEGAADNDVGGESAAARNVISGNKQYGVRISLPGGLNNRVRGNFVGLAANGTSVLSNGLSGIVVDGPGNIIGGANAGSGNVISGNREYGIYLALGSDNCVVEGNYIGTDSTGSKAAGNAIAGLRMESAVNRIGGTGAGDGNLISGNYNSGLFLYGLAASNNVIQGNRIGLNIAGAVLSNAWYGISISNAPGTIIGSGGTDGRNIISGNGYGGIFVSGTNAVGARIQGNFIGTDPTGTLSRGNGDCGIYVLFSPSNTIGGVAAGNLISGNASDGIRIEEKQSRANVIQGNYVGTDVTGSNGLGNSTFGIIISNAPQTTIGGSISGAGNLISDNGRLLGDGIQVTGPGAIGNVIQGNWVGISADGVSALGNSAHGIEFVNTANGNLVGGNVPAADNHVAFNGLSKGGYDGIRVQVGCASNFISRNSIFSNNVYGTNTSLGIDFGDNGVTTNNVPVLNWATSGAQTVMKGSIKASAKTVYRLQFYSSPSTNVAGYGEGMHYVGSQLVTNNKPGVGTFTATLTNILTAGQFVTATATDPSGTTFEFSRPVTVTIVGVTGAMVLTDTAVPPRLPTTLGQGTSTSLTSLGATLAIQTRTILTLPSIPAPLAANLSFTESAAVTGFEYTKPELIALRTNGPSTNRLNIVFFPEGYTTNELRQFIADAQRAADGLLSAPPYLEYRDYCNVYAIVVPSEQSGASHPEWPLKRNTYFNSSYDSTLDYILTMPPNELDTNYANGRGKIDALLQTFMPHCGLPIVLVNELVPGGSGGGVCIASLGEPFPELMIHESGHTLSHLGDEYTESRDYASSLDSDTEPNTTKETQRASIKWNIWINASTPVPTSETATQYAGAVGLFQGAHYNATGWYRPRINCIMRQMDSGAPFCEVCSEAQVKAIYGQVRPVDSFSPSGNMAFVPTNQSRTFTVSLQQPLTHSLSVQWYLNGTAIPGATNADYKLPWSSVVGRIAVLKATVSDLTSLVRNDPANVLEQSVTWNVAPVGFPVAPAIVAQPLSQKIGAGSNAVLSVVVRGSEPLLYQWRHAGADLPGKTSSTLTLTNIQVGDAGTYLVLVTNDFGRVSSATAVVTVTLPVRVRIVGPGSTIPNYDGQWLEFGKKYTVTAQPALKCIFSNWTGSVYTNKPKLTFTPSPSLVLTATFADPVPPTLSITAPAERARLTNGIVNIAGLAGDNVGIQVVRFRLNGADWTEAASSNHWTNWSASAPVPAGSNVIEAISVDSAGNQSVSAVRHFTRVVMQPLRLLTNGVGSVTPNQSGKSLELGQFYTITAVPGKGQIFAGWSAGARTTELKFQMTSNLVLQANFVTNPFVALKGVYNGLFQAAGNTSLDSFGSIKLTMTDQGAFTGALLGIPTNSFTGKFWVDGIAQVNVVRGGKPTVLNLALDITNHTDQIRGQVTNGTWVADLRCDRAQAGSVAAALYTNTMAMLSESNGQSFGDGIGSVKINATGALSFTGTLADGTAVSQSTSLSKDGLWPFYVSLYGGKGSIMGWITVTNTGNESLSGAGQWIKTPIRNAYYPGGFTNAVQITGSTFQPAKSKTRILNLTNANVIIRGANIPIPQTNSIVLSSNNIVTVTAGTNNLKLPLSSTNGLINGTFTHPVTRTTTALRGVLLQQSATARGFFLGVTNSGTLRLEPVEQ